jgi:hypothetical protein
MIAVIFEVEPADGRIDDYLAVAAKMRPLLEQQDGFISVERFQSLTTPASSCRCPSGATRRRSGTGAASARTGARRRWGREGMFAGYRLRVAGVIRDYGLHDRAEAPEDSLLAHA